MRRPTRAALLLSIFLCQTASAQAAGGAYVVDDAAIGAPDHCQTESWLSFADSGDRIAVIQPACVVNVGVPVEFTVLMEGLRSDHAWTAVTGLQAKTILLPLERSSIGLGLSAGTIFNLTRGENVLSFVNAPITLKPNEALRLNLNGGWSHDGIIDQHFLTYGAGFEWDFDRKITLIGEIFGQLGACDETPRFQAGLRYAPVNKVDLDVLYGYNITGESAHWLTTGITIRF